MCCSQHYTAEPVREKSNPRNSYGIWTNGCVPVDPLWKQQFGLSSGEQSVQY